MTCYHQALDLVHSLIFIILGTKHQMHFKPPTFIQTLTFHKTIPLLILLLFLLQCNILNCSLILILPMDNYNVIFDVRAAGLSCYFVNVYGFWNIYITSYFVNVYAGYKNIYNYSNRLYYQSCSNIKLNHTILCFDLRYSFQDLTIING